MNEQNKKVLDDIVGMTAEMTEVEREVLLAYANGIAVGKKIAAAKGEKKSEESEENSEEAGS